MNSRILILLVITLCLGLAIGLTSQQWLRLNETSQSNAAQVSDKQPLFWRNPMNPAITSPVFTQDEMGMDYLPVYAEEDTAKEPEVLFWRNPMNPAITSSVFTQDEMGMDYLPVYANNSSANEVTGTVTIDPVTIQNIGVRTAIAEYRELARVINALGHVEFNEQRLARLHPKTSGWVQSLNVDETGTAVKRDTILLSVYSPDLVAAQQEFLVALDNYSRIKTDSAKRVLQSARERLELFDVPQHQINELEAQRKLKKYIHIHSPFEGWVMNIGVREGQYITPKDQLYMIADLKNIWVNLDIYEDDLPWIKVGDSAELQVRAAPGRLFKGKVSFIAPIQDSKTRTLRVRLEFKNADLILKPGMFANVIVHTDKQNNALVVPSEAIVRSGKREQVFVAKAGGKFEPRDVLLGISAEGYTQILAGVTAGESVVTSSQFLIDSESKLREATAKMLEAQKLNTSQDNNMPDMDDMSMDDMSMDELDMNDMDMSNIGEP